MTDKQRNPTIGERLDSFIGVFSPQKALERKMARIQLRYASGYEGAELSRNSAGWHPVTGSGEAINATSRDMARARARDLERNSDVVNSVINAFTRNVVGKGFMLQVRTENEEWNNQLENLWQEWCRPGNCDVTGRYSLNEVLKLIVRRRLVDGGVLAIKTIDKSVKIPYQLQLTEVDCLDAPGTLTASNGNPIVGGIEVNSVGKAQGYWVKQYDLETYVQQDPVRIPADRVFYLADHARISEVREISPLVRTVNTIRDLDEFFDATGFKQKITAATAAFITTAANAGAAVGSSLLARNNNDVKTKDGDAKRIVPGSITELKPGQDIKTLVPTGQASEFAEFNLASMRRIGASYGLSYEMTSRDVSKVNYSSARQNMLEDWKVFESEQQYLIEHFLNFVFADVVDAAILAGRINPPKDYYQRKESYLKHEFLGQGLPWIDPQKEAQANTILLQSGQSNLKALYARKGLDWEEELRQLANEQKLMQELGLQKGEKDNE
ncbi:phage portal protein [Phascolarctobacterium sp.]|uniref:phage portal protein n=1 Tax=Phascolarctobacterium sp. TaxID=2049039 RepID=UPI00386875E1